MEPVLPELAAPIRTIAEGQDGFRPVVGAFVQHPLYGAPQQVDGWPVNTTVVAFRPNAEELARLNAGADLYVALLTFGGPMQGIILYAGKEEAAAAYGIHPLPDLPRPDATPPAPSLGELNARFVDETGG